MLAAVTLGLAFVCPPIEEAVQARQLGEQCGGTCDTYGKCAAGLFCRTEQTTSPFSMAILMGGTKKAGSCASVTGDVEDRRQLQLGGRVMAGGSSAADIDAPEVSAAAKFAVKTMMERSNSLTPATLARVVSATQQVVAGMKYTLDMIMSDGSEHHVVIIDQAWMTPRYTLLSDDIVTH